MTNAEKYKDLIVKISNEQKQPYSCVINAVRLELDFGDACYMNYNCNTCKSKVIEWLLSECDNPQSEKDYPLKNMEKILVRNEDSDEWEEAYFLWSDNHGFWCKYDKDDTVARNWKHAAWIL